MTTTFSRFVGCAILLIVSAPSGWSQSTTYFDRSAFLDACRYIPGNHQTISFSQDEVPSDIIGSVLTLSGVTFAARSLARQIDSTVNSTEPVLHNFDGGGPLGIHFGTGARAFGADYSSLLALYHSSFAATVSLDNGEVFTFTAPSNPNSRFFGFISPHTIHHITFSDGGVYGSPPFNMHEELIGNLYMVLEVPEPASATVLVLGAAALWWQRREAGRA